ncbi:14738_t:CDS:2, partial [Dentiscutata erythropus]
IVVQYCKISISLEYVNNKSLVLMTYLSSILYMGIVKLGLVLSQNKVK